MDKATQSLEVLLSAAAALSGAEPKGSKLPDVATVLRGRLERAYEVLQESDHDDLIEMNLRTLQYVTARVSLRVIERMQDVLDLDAVKGVESPVEPPLLGTRNLSHVRTLLSIIFKWRIEPLLAELESARSSQQPSTPPSYPRVIDLTDKPINFEELPDSLICISRLLFRKDGTSRVRQTWITSCVLSQHAVDVLLPCLIVGWAPKPLHETFIESGKDIKGISVRLINLLRPNEAIAALGTILANINTKRKIYPYVPRVCGFLLSKQLSRPEGLRGLCIAVLGDELEESEIVPLDKLEHICKVLSTIPSSTTLEDYFCSIIPRVLELLVPSTAERTPSGHKRAAAFTLSRMLSPDFQYSKIVSTILLPMLHKPFTDNTPTMPEVNMGDNRKFFKLSALESLQTLQAFMLYSDPSPTSLSILLTPIIPELYALLALYRVSKVADPNIRESLNALLGSWGRIVFSEDAVKGLWKIVLGTGRNWEINSEGFAHSTKPLTQPSISLLTAVDLEGKSKDEIDITANPFNLQPDPLQFVAYMKTLDRQDVSSEIFIKLLNEYRDLKDSSEDPMKTLLYLQLILQMQDQLSTSVLSRPKYVLSFVKHTLSSVPPSTTQIPLSTFKKGLGLDDLRIVDKNNELGDDSDDEDEDVTLGEEGNGGKDEVINTSISLLLSILEGHPDLSPNNTADLNDIMSSLGDLTLHTSPTIRQLAREARLVLTARSASTSSTTTSNIRAEPTVEPAHVVYQKALKLLQDPIIPVRAHGLQLLRELVSRSARKSNLTTSQDELLDSALVPGILSILFQSIQDDESFIYLNAVQGLAAMVDGYGGEVLKGLMDAYLVGTGVRRTGEADLGGIDMKETELDARIRVGEAISTVVRRLGDALGAYVNILIPSLLTIIRSSYLPTTLRTSALSILALCANSYVVALHPYIANLAETCVELLQLETVATKHLPSKQDRDKGNAQIETEAETETERKSQQGEDQKSINKPAPLFPKPPSYPRGPDPQDQNPTTTTSKAASFRRSAIHLLSQLFRANIQLVYDEQARFASKVLDPEIRMNAIGRIDIGIKGVGKMKGIVFPESVMRRAKVVLGYVAVTDEDGVCRVMAREARELVEQYEGAVIAGL